jgi:hypothetical protein
VPQKGLAQASKFGSAGVDAVEERCGSGLLHDVRNRQKLVKMNAFMVRDMERKN